jgi:hypothetical protein
MTTNRSARINRGFIATALATFTVTLVVVPASARADEEREHHDSRLDLAVDFDGAAIVNEPHPLSGNSLSGGSGIKVRLGEQFRMPFLRFTPEIGYGFMHLFASDDTGAAYAWDTHRVFAGARLGLGEIVVPTVYAHVGYGWRETGDPTIGEASGVTFDAGLALDIHIIPHLGFGAHAEYVTINSMPYTPQWIGLGLHADLLF